MGQGDGQGHELLGLVAGVAEHHALVAGAVIQLIAAGLLGLQALVNAHGDVGGLLVNGGQHGTGVTVKAVLGPVIADVPHHLAGQLGDIDVAGGGDLAHDVDQTGGHRGLTGHAGSGIGSQNGVQNGVGDLVADLIGMSFGHGLRGKQSLCHHNTSFLHLEDEKTLRKGGASQSVHTLILRYTTAGFGTLPKAGCRGFIGPVPQPLLIRLFSYRAVL